jgi:stearoyl-CoA desaturase (delta-9 desaturase)
MLSAEGSPLMWVATHRKHHVHSDLDDDPHSPNHGTWWSHMLWFAPANTPEELEALFTRWAPDLYKDPVQQFLHRHFGLVPVILGVVLFGIGQFFFGQGISWVLWGLCLRMVVAYHSTWFVNSATHIWGYRNYETRENSRNNWLLALATKIGDPLLVTIGRQNCSAAHCYHGDPGVIDTGKRHWRRRCRIRSPSTRPKWP